MAKGGVIMQYWFGLVPKGTQLSMQDWVRIQKLVRKYGVRKNDVEGVRKVVHEYIDTRSL